MQTNNDEQQQTENSDNYNENVEQSEDNVDIINELIQLGFADRNEIVDAIKIVVNKKDINSIVDQITENRSKTQLKDMTNEMQEKEEKKEEKKEDEEENVFPVSVYVRMRPLISEEIKDNHQQVDYNIKNKKKSKSQSLTLKKCSGKDMSRDKQYSGFKRVILPKENNLYTFKKCILPSMSNVFRGVSTCVFAYGHTGSGKTHTIFGYNAEKGMYRLFAKELCQRVEALNNDTFIEIRFTELYQGIVRDLLSNDKKECFLREDDKGNIHLRGQTMKYEDGRVIVEPITSFHVTTPVEVDKYIMEGMLSRNVGKSTLHDQSSRSHAFLEFELVNQALVDARIELPEKQAVMDVFKRKYDIVRKGAGGHKSQLPKMEKKMNKLKSRIKTLKKQIKSLTNDVDKPYIGGDFIFVDLAGNEYGRDVKNSNKSEEKERNEINKSLFALKECIRGLHEKDKNSNKRVPYRGSKLTMYLRKYLKGDGSKAIMISNIGSSKHYTKQTVNTLQYCQLVAKA